MWNLNKKQKTNAHRVKQVGGDCQRGDWGEKWKKWVKGSKGTIFQL